MQSTKDSKKRCKIKIDMSYFEPDESGQAVPPAAAFSEATMGARTLLYEKGKLKVKVLRATDVDPVDRGGNAPSDPMVRLELPGARRKKAQKRKTQVKKDELNPVWNEEFVLEVGNVYKDELTVTLEDWNILSDKEIGRKSIPVIDVVNAPNRSIVDKAYRIGPGKCRLYLSLNYYEPERD